MICDIEEFIKAFHGQRRRTQWVVDAIPLSKGDWQPWPGEPTCSELIRSIAAGHLMYATAFVHDRWVIDDYENISTTWDETLRYFDETTEQALDMLRPLPNSALKQKRHRPDDPMPTGAWRFLLALLEHEIAGRCQLASYLMMMNARQPEMGGLTIKAVRASLEHQKSSSET
jgi:hypothetical protein